MLKIILKNLWQRRRQNAWLFAELIIVTILTWVIVDPTVVGIYDVNTPLGYDADRIVRVTVSSYPEEADLYDPDYATAEAREEAYNALRAKADRLPMVEMSSYLSEGIDDYRTANYGLAIGDEAIDTVVGAIYAMGITPGERFFTLYGIESIDGSPTAEQLDNGLIGVNDVVITESVDRTYWPDRRGVKGKRFVSCGYNGDTIYTNVIAIIKDFRYHAATQTGAVGLFCDIYDYRSKRQVALTLRLADGVNADDYVRDYGDAIRSSLRTGNYYVSEIMSQRDQIRYIDANDGTTSRRNLHFFIAALFLINLIVGVTGCVWLQTGKRVSELGVLRSYGALKSHIMGMLMGETGVMAFIAFIIGDVIYLQYALKEGLSIGNENNAGYIRADSWIYNFGEHFVIISVIVLIIILICVAIGTYFPARHVSKIEPVDALHDE
ncbi:MAG: FtsX-like permease family protein [Muribaculaceae bacterium]|nr:FtsX-like permease family protein [Muribaculaceae bacterium]